jgi:hypothetical protein
MLLAVFSRLFASYAMFLWSALQYQEADLILPEGGKIHIVRISPGTSYTDAVLVHQETATTSATPTQFYQAHMAWNGDGWNVTLTDGTVYVFGENAPLPNGRWITFAYNGSNHITQATDNIGHIGRTVTYTYSSGNLSTVTDVFTEALAELNRSPISLTPPTSCSTRRASTPS